MLAYEPGSPIRIESSPEAELPDLGELLRGTQPKSSQRSSASQASTSKRPNRSQPTPVRRSQPASTQEMAPSQPTPSSGKRKNEEREPEVIPDSSPEPEPRPKRARTSSALNRHPDFWHLDGSVIVRVENTLFKLHRSRLAKHSKYFAQLFAAKGKGKQADSGSDADVEADDAPSMTDGMATYLVHETTVEDFERLLVLFDDPIAHMDGPPPFPILASILRASTALSFENLRNWAVRILECMWPQELNALKDEETPHAAETIVLAQTCDVPRVRKRAYYELLRTPMFGQEEPAEDDVILLDNDGNVQRDDVGTKLSAQNYATLVRAREKLNDEWIAAAAYAPSDIVCPLAIKGREPDGSSKKQVCISADEQKVDWHWTTSVHKTGIFAEDMLDPVLGLDNLIAVDWKKGGYCKECTTMRRNSWRKLRERWWASLDRWLQLK
ncbi:hypothetical protein BV25DRAFT_1157099 [Artomyces pyxidatus]|uniref:Uncharacterized protein n=1 Tax=Artomyces pyxidatus TaxID=48021 RepID=A0ACB8SU14_9AGAM|nr:hypothetical protein BV25DRAFT_1157099 [Artomyces pyxidatus]